MKINSMQRAVFAVLFMTVFASGAQAFSYPSHAVVCDLAYQYAAPETQKMISGWFGSRGRLVHSRNCAAGLTG